MCLAVERTLGRISLSEDLSETLSTIIKSLVDDFRRELGISGGRIYQQRGSAYVFVKQYGEGPRIKAGFRVPLTYPPIQDLRKKGYIVKQAGVAPAGAGFRGETR